MKNLIAMVMMVMLVMTTTSCGSHEANEKPEIQTSVSSVSENETEPVPIKVSTQYYNDYLTYIEKADKMHDIELTFMSNGDVRYEGINESGDKIIGTYYLTHEEIVDRLWCIQNGFHY